MKFTKRFANLSTKTTNATDAKKNPAIAAIITTTTNNQIKCRSFSGAAFYFAFLVAVNTGENIIKFTVNNYLPPKNVLSKQKTVL